METTAIAADGAACHRRRLTTHHHRRRQLSSSPSAGVALVSQHSASKVGARIAISAGSLIGLPMAAPATRCGAALRVQRSVDGRGTPAKAMSKAERDFGATCRVDGPGRVSGWLAACTGRGRQ